MSLASSASCRGQWRVVVIRVSCGTRGLLRIPPESIVTFSACLLRFSSFSSVVLAPHAAGTSTRRATRSWCCSTRWASRRCSRPSCGGETCCLASRHSLPTTPKSVFHPWLTLGATPLSDCCPLRLCWSVVVCMCCRTPVSLSRPHVLALPLRVSTLTCSVLLFICAARA